MNVVATALQPTLADAVRSALSASVHGDGVCLWCGSHAVSLSGWSPGAEVTMHCAECGSDLSGMADMRTRVSRARSGAVADNLSAQEGAA